MTRRTAACLLAFVLPAAQATSFSTDYSDLWWNPAEDGWGVNVIQQRDVLFLTFFIYGADGKPTWYVASDVGTLGSTTRFDGPLYATTGSPFSASWQQSQRTTREVGTVSFIAHDPSNATVVYSVDGVTVEKSVQRQTWRTNILSGEYIGGSVGTYSNSCPTPGYAEEPGVVTVIDSGTSASIQVAGSTTACSYTPSSRTQAGRLARMSGSFSCANGFTGTFSLTEAQATPQGFTARATLQGDSCTWLGRIGGVRRGQ